MPPESVLLIVSPAPAQMGILDGAVAESHRGAEGGAADVQAGNRLQ